jgi:hypothetical protein
MKKIAACTFFALSAISALPASSAQAAPNQQWKDDSTTFATLIQSGYRLVTVDHVPGADSQGSMSTVYYLQKESSVFACHESHHVGDARPGSASGEFACAELVQPYDSTLPPQQ